MAQKKNDVTSALVTVMDALDPLSEDERRWVLQSAANRWTINVNAHGAAGGGSDQLGGATGGMTVAPGTPIKSQGAKAFMLAKEPDSDIQRIACLAYYLTHAKDTPTFKARDITTTNTESKGPKFNIPRAVGNATRASCGYLSSVGGGKKQLTAYGEEIVDALPNHDAVKALEAKHKKGKRRGTRKKKTRKAAKKKA